MTLSRRIVAAGINIAIALIANTLATGATLITLIFTFGPISGGHFNPEVTLADASLGGISQQPAHGINFMNDGVGNGHVSGVIGTDVWIAMGAMGD